MAIGSKGSFATTSAAGIDVAGMMRSAQKEQSRLANQKLAMDTKVEEEKSSIFSSMETPSFDPTGEETTDTLLHKGVGMMKDKLYEYHKQMENGDLSIRELRGVSASYNKKLSQFNDDVKMVQQSANNFLKIVENGDLSTGMSNNSISVLDGVVQGKINEIEIAGDGSMVIGVNGEKMTLAQYNQIANNPPRNSKLDAIVSDLGEDFVTRIDKAPDPSNFFKDIETRELTDTHKNEIMDIAISLANNPKYQNDLWAKTKQEQDKYTFNENEVADLENEVYNRILKGVKNRVDTYSKETLDRSNQRQSAKDAKEEAKDKIQVTGTTNVSTYVTDEEFNSILKENPNYFEGVTNRKDLMLNTITQGKYKTPYAQLDVPSGIDKKEGVDLSDMNIDAFNYNNETGELFVAGYIELPTGTESERQSWNEDVQKDGQSVAVKKSKDKSLPSMDVKNKVTGFLTGAAKNDFIARLEADGIQVRQEEALTTTGLY